MFDPLSRRGLFLLMGGVTGAGLGGVALRNGASKSLGTRRSTGWLRPPGALPEERFLGACLRCGMCVEACPSEALELADVDGGFSCGAPYVRSREVGCNLCAGHDSLLCVDICPTDALQPVDDYREVAMGVAVIDRDHCLSWQGTICRACWHACPYPGEAIALDWRTRPAVVADACVGCGLCDHVCLTEPSSVAIIPADQFHPGDPTHVGESRPPF